MKENVKNAIAGTIAKKIRKQKNIHRHREEIMIDILE
jgi:hypothetical protein